MGVSQTRHRNVLRSRARGGRPQEHGTLYCSLCLVSLPTHPRDDTFCCRCSRPVCRRCSSRRQYRSKRYPPSCLCAVCGHEQSHNLLQHVSRDVWVVLYAFCDHHTQQCLLELCHATQMGVILPFPYAPLGWGCFFQERRFLSKGANGTVYLSTLHSAAPHTTPALGAEAPTAWSWRGGMQVTVKAIDKRNIFSISRWRHIQNEAATQQRCRSPHVAELLCVVQGPSEVYMVLPYYPRGDLFHWIVQQQIPKERDVMLIARQLLEALHYMHKRCSVVHRDVKPENILYDCDEHNNFNVFLTDFGYAKYFCSTAEECSTNGCHCSEEMVSASPQGTLGFAAPEVLSAYKMKKQGGANAMTPVELLQRMDVFAAGVTLCILLTGCEPFRSASAESFTKAVERGIDFSGPEWTYASTAAQRLLRQMTALRAADRPSVKQCLGSDWLCCASSPAVPHTHSSPVTASVRHPMGSLQRNANLVYTQDDDGRVGAMLRPSVESGCITNGDVAQ
ncbi:protein kinase [Strigomonas culicis]|nr:protein kinase [Strigomonas culicis]|eukprot:EPY22631.1 protein kinase [Strigomonas culicis]